MDSAARQDSAVLFENNVRSVRGRHVFGAAIAEVWDINSLKEMLPGAEQDRGDGEMQLVDQCSAKVFSDR